MPAVSTLPPLDWHVLFTHWEVQPIWDAVLLVALAAYTYGLVLARRRGTGGLHPVRVLLYVAGLAVLAVTLNSAIQTYSRVLFWDHMVQHLLLIMVVPSLFVLGHPLTLLAQVSQGRVHDAVLAVLGSRPVSLLTHPLIGLAIYTVVIVATHLTQFMNLMATQAWAHQLESVIYLAGGYLFLLPLLGDEPIRWRPPYMTRIFILFVGMAPDTVVGIVLMQATHVMFPAMAAQRPDWAPGAVRDLQIGGGIMWAFGDGLMMAFLLGLIIAFLANTEGNTTAGRWLEGVRRQNLAHQLGMDTAESGGLDAGVEVDEDEAILAAYNQMLERMNRREQQP